MNIKALITALVLSGSSSVAMARPNLTASVEASWRFGSRPARPVVIRDHRYEQPVVRHPVLQVEDDCGTDFGEMNPNNNAITEDASVYKGPVPATRTVLTSAYGYSTSWMAMTAPTRIDRGRQFITDLPDLGRQSRVRLQGNAGTTYIEQVLIRFRDGSEQVVKVNARLDRYNPTLDIRLDRAKSIISLVVYGSSSQGSAYQILAL